MKQLNLSGGIIKGNLIMLILTALAVNVYGQESEDTLLKPQVLWKISPFHFFDNTLRFSSEFYNADNTVSFEVSAGVSTNSGWFMYDGGEMIFTLKKYILPFKIKESRKGNEYLRSVYIGFDLRGGYYEGFGEDYFEYDDPINGPTWSLENIDHKVKLIQPGFRIGLQQSFWDVLFLEVFLGGGLRLTDIDINNPHYDPERSNNFDMSDKAYEGVVPNIGFDIGIPLK